MQVGAVLIEGVLLDKGRRDHLKPGACEVSQALRIVRLAN